MDNILHSLNFDAHAFVIQIILFVGLHFAMRGILYDHMIAERNKRDGKINSRLAQAEKMAGNARRLKAEYEEKVRSLRHELNGVLVSETATAQAEAAEKLKSAQAEADTIQESARKAVDQERASMEAAMEARADELARAVGRRVVESNLPPAAAQRTLSKIGS